MLHKPDKVQIDFISHEIIALQTVSDDFVISRELFVTLVRTRGSSLNGMKNSRHTNVSKSFVQA